MDTERNNRKDNLTSDMVKLSEMPEFDEYRETIQQISTQTEAPKIQILKYTTEDSRLVEERLKNYDILDPNAWELFVVNQATEALNRYRQKYGNKLPKLKENIKLRIVANETDLSELRGAKGYDGDTGGFALPNGELYVAGGYRDDEIEMAHIIIHEMTHEFAGEYRREFFKPEDNEAATELVTIEVLADLLCDDSLSYDLPAEYNTIPKREGVLKFLQTHYQTYNDFINNLKQKEQEEKGHFTLDSIKEMLFSGYDRVNWGYNKTPGNNT